MKEQSNGQDDLVLDLRGNHPDNDLCARPDCGRPRWQHPLNLPDYRVGHHFTLEVDLAREAEAHRRST